jgi:hypothetical protein
MSCLSFVSRHNLRRIGIVGAERISISVVRRNRATYLTVIARITVSAFQNHDSTRTRPRASIFVGSASRPSCRRGSLIDFCLPPTVLKMASDSCLFGIEGRGRIGRPIHIACLVDAVKRVIAARSVIVVWN